MYAYTYVWMYVCIHVCVDVCMHTCMCVCVFCHSPFCNIIATTLVRALPTICAFLPDSIIFTRWEEV